MSNASQDLPRLGRYQVLRKLAQGGMAEIFLAKAIGVMGFERLTAVKLIHQHLIQDTDFVKMFIDEARISMQLHHRNIVQTIDLDKTDDTYFIAMEYVHGVNLYDLYERIASKGRWIDLPMALYIISEACKGLHFAHTRIGADGRPLGIVHRDISPQNIMLSFEGEVKITDFGIAKAAERLHQTTPGIVKGKYAYMAPEILEDKPADPKVDVFAAGVVLYELLVSENPFAHASPVETIENVLNKEIPPPTTRGAPGNPALDDIVMRALARNPAERFQSAMELSDALTDFGLSQTTSRRDMAAGDTSLAGLLAELFPERAGRVSVTADDNVNLPMASGAPPPAPPPQRKAERIQTDLDPEIHDEEEEKTMLGAAPPEFLQALESEPPTITPQALDLFDDEPDVTARPRENSGLITEQSLPAITDEDDDEHGDTSHAAGLAPTPPTASSHAGRSPPPAPPPSMVGPNPGLFEGFDATVPSPAISPEQIAQHKAAIVAEANAAASGSLTQPPSYAPGHTPSAPTQPPAGALPNRGSPSVTAPPLGTTAPPPGVNVPPTPGKVESSRSTIVAIVLVVLAVAVVGATLVIKSFGATNSVSIPLTSAPPGATVTIDGVEQPGKTPLNATVTVGEPHIIVFSAPGRKPTTKKIWPRAGVSSAVHAELAEQ